ncbi:MAG: FMN-binding negative transcriptional regulator [Fimbriimonadaceae bacterium]|nr:FMN-binding negative transcriptional regulator [Fimbriimonadaceae bacterium]
MYVPAPFRLDDLPAQLAVLRQAPFAVLLTPTPVGCCATHLPLLHCPQPAPLGRLVGHLAAANPHADQLAAGPSLAIFSGAHGYLSPTWYQTRPAVPTWNYIAVHASGQARPLADPAAADEVLQALVEHFERGQPQPWDGALPADLRQSLRAAIMAFEMPLTALQGVAKLSQNKPAEDLAGVLAALETSPRASDQELAAAMRQANGRVTG